MQSILVPGLSSGMLFSANHATEHELGRFSAFGPHGNITVTRTRAHQRRKRKDTFASSHSLPHSRCPMMHGMHKPRQSTSNHNDNDGSMTTCSRAWTQKHTLSQKTAWPPPENLYKEMLPSTESQINSFLVSFLLVSFHSDSDTVHPLASDTWQRAVQQSNIGFASEHVLGQRSCRTGY